MANPKVHPCPIVPLRMCVTCRQTFPRDGLFRLLREHASGKVTLWGPGQGDLKRFGRSAYLCPSPSCIQQALKGKRLHKTLKTAVPDDILNYLDSYLKGNN